MSHRKPHYLDDALKSVCTLPSDELKPELARLLINLCGSIRALERENARLNVALGLVDEAAADAIDNMTGFIAGFSDREAS